MRRRRFIPVAALATLFLLALGGSPLLAADEAGGASWGGFDYRQAAEQNRYLVKAKLLEAPAPNMEPAIPHPGQIQESINRLQAKGFCAEVLARSCKSCRFDPAREKGCRKPNILIFLVDDMGWGDFGPYGGGLAYGAATPNVNQLAAKGLLLTSTYSQPTCSPSRATIHTGQLPVHHGVLYPPMYGDPGGLTEKSITLPWLLKKMGYRTQGVGKWHMGENLPNLPQNVGYDDYLGFLSVSDMYTEWRDQYYNPEVVRDEERTTYMDNNHFSHYMIHASTELKPPAEVQARIETSKDDERKSPGCEALAEITIPWEAKALEGQKNRGNTNHCWVRPENESKKISIADLDKVWVDYSTNFLRKMAGSREPWFLYHATRGCHFDNYPNLGDRRLSYARTIYSDCTVEMDEILGQLMKTLKETGQDESTLVFMSSDNGPEDEIPPHGHTPFRGGKGDTWEGGVRVPGIAYWPGMIDAGRQSDGIFNQADLYTTALTLAGFDYAHPEQNPGVGKELADFLKNRYVYGIDQTSFLLAKEGESSRRSNLDWYLTTFAAVRMDELKAHVAVTEPVGLSQGYAGGLSGVTLPVSYLWMFNLQEDPKESDNINIRHLWAQHLFSGEFQRFYCVLVDYPPFLPTSPMKEIMVDDRIQDLKEHPLKWKEICKSQAQILPTRD